MNTAAMQLPFAEQYYRNLLFELLTPESEWLDLGCGHQLLPGWLKDSSQDQQALSARCRRLIGADLAVDDLVRHPYLGGRVICNLHRLPFRDNSFSLVTARSVVEHIEAPEPFLAEASRILKPGGQILLATPNLLYYQCLVASVTPDPIKKILVRKLEGRAEQDVFPTFYRLNTPSTLKRLAGNCGFTVSFVKTVESLPELIRLGHPFVQVERVITRILRHTQLYSFRAVIIALLQKPAIASG